MLYSKTTKYAVLALAEIARLDSKNAVATRKVADRTGVPYPLLAKILVQLKEAGLVESRRGKQGGIRLGTRPDEIRLFDVIAALEGTSWLTDCPLWLDACSCDRRCDLHRIWQPTRETIVSFLQETTIADLAAARGTTIVL